MSKKVVHLTTVHSWQDPRVFHKECKSLAKNGYEVHLITKDGLDKVVDGVYVHKLDYNIRSKWLRVLFSGYFAWKQALALDPELIHFHDPELITWSLFFANRNKKVIYDIHEDYTTAIAGRPYIPKVFKNLVRKIINVFERKAYEKWNSVIAEDYYSERFPGALKIRNYPIIDINEKRLSFGEGYKNKLLYTGTLDFSRGVLNHAKLHNYLKEKYEIRLVGRCSTKVYAEIEKIIGDEVGKVVPFGVCKFVPYSDILKEYESQEYIAGLALFDKSEHFARKRLTKFYEYMLHGLPVIGTNFNEWTSFLEENQYGYTADPNDFDRIEFYLSKITEETSIDNKNRLRQEVLSKFNWCSENERLCNLYKKII